MVISPNKAEPDYRILKSAYMLSKLGSVTLVKCMPANTIPLRLIYPFKTDFIQPIKKTSYEKLKLKLKKNFQKHYAKINKFK